MRTGAVVPSLVVIACLAFADEVETHAVRFTIVETEVERWPAPVSITIKDLGDGSTRNVSIDSRSVTKPQTISSPKGTYEMTFAAPHHRAVQRTVRLDAGDLDLGTVTLARFPTIAGSVRDAGGSPVVGAFVTDRARLSAKTDPLGAFSIEVDGEWPSHLEISYPGLTTKDVAIAKARTSVKLDPITLTRGIPLALEVSGVNQDLDFDLVTHEEPAHPRLLKTVHVSKDAPRVTFEDLDPGDYVVIVRGGGPLQKLATAVAVRSSQDVPRQIHLEPIAADIEVRRGDTSVGGAAITVIADSNRWTSEMQTSEEGHVLAEAWQRGDYAFAVHSVKDGPPLMLTGNIDGNSTAKVVLEIPDRTITGRVVDADNSSPIVNANVEVESTNDDGTGGTLTATTNAAGKFTIDSIRDGSHVLTATAENHLYSEPIRITIDPSSPKREVTFRLSRGMSRPIRVTWQNGAPVRGATVLEMINGAVMGMYATDDDGRAVLHTMPDRGVVVYVVPAEGSFAIGRLGETPVEREGVVVPYGLATLELYAKDDTGKPIVNLRFVMRYEGEMIPPDVSDILERRRGLAAMTGADGVARLERLPAGFYELWPVRAVQEGADVRAAPIGANAVQVGVKEGLNTARITFRRKH